MRLPRPARLTAVSAAALLSVGLSACATEDPPGQDAPPQSTGESSPAAAPSSAAPATSVTVTATTTTTPPPSRTSEAVPETSKSSGGLPEDVAEVREIFGSIAPASLFGEFDSCNSSGIDNAWECSGREVGQFQFFEEARHPLVDNCDAVATCRLRQGAAKPGFTDTAGAGDDQVALVGDPFAREQALEQRLVETAPRAVIDVFRAGTHMAQPGRAHAGFKALGFSAGDLTVNQQAKPFSVAEISGCILCLQFGEDFGHTVKPQSFQVIEGWVGKHGCPFNGSNRRHGCWGG